MNKCKDCGKDIIDADSYGDYDDACEWTCNCQNVKCKKCKEMFNEGEIDGGLCRTCEGEQI